MSFKDLFLSWTHPPLPHPELDEAREVQRRAQAEHRLAEIRARLVAIELDLLAQAHDHKRGDTPDA